MKTILVIDDDVDVRATLCENLRYCGYEILEANDGDQGLEIIQIAASPPDLVITDIIMPKREGIETIMEIRRQFPSIKIIAISGGGRTKSTDFLELARKLGSDATFAKPIDIDLLEQTVERLLNPS